MSLANTAFSTCTESIGLSLLPSEVTWAITQPHMSWFFYFNCLLSGISLGSGSALAPLLALEAKSTKSTETRTFLLLKQEASKPIKNWKSKSIASAASSNPNLRIPNIICTSVHDFSLDFPWGWWSCFMKALILYHIFLDHILWWY